MESSERTNSPTAGTFTRVFFTLLNVIGGGVVGLIAGSRATAALIPSDFWVAGGGDGVEAAYRLCGCFGVLLGIVVAAFGGVFGPWIGQELGVWQGTGQKQGTEAVPPAGGMNFRVRFTFFILLLCLLCVIALCLLFLLELWHALK